MKELSFRLPGPTIRQCGPSLKFCLTTFSHETRTIGRGNNVDRGSCVWVTSTLFHNLSRGPQKPTRTLDRTITMDIELLTNIAPSYSIDDQRRGLSDLLSIEPVKPPSIAPGRLPITGLLVRALFRCGALGVRDSKTSSQVRWVYTQGVARRMVQNLSPVGGVLKISTPMSGVRLCFAHECGPFFEPLPRRTHTLEATIPRNGWSR